MAGEGLAAPPPPALLPTVRRVQNHPFPVVLDRPQAFTARLCHQLSYRLGKCVVLHPPSSQVGSLFNV